MLEKRGEEEDEMWEMASTTLSNKISLRKNLHPTLFVV